MIMNASMDQNSVTFRGLEPGVLYTVNVDAVNIRDMTLRNNAPPVTVPPPEGQH